MQYPKKWYYFLMRGYVSYYPGTTKHVQHTQDIILLAGCTKPNICNQVVKMEVINLFSRLFPI